MELDEQRRMQIAEKHSRLAAERAKDPKGNFERERQINDHIQMGVEDRLSKQMRGKVPNTPAKAFERERLAYDRFQMDVEDLAARRRRNAEERADAPPTKRSRML